MPWTTPGTASAGSVLTASYWNTQVRDNLLEVAPFMSAWSTWVPSSRSGLTIGNGTEKARYIKVGKLVCVFYNFTLGSTSSVSGDVTIALPAAQPAAAAVPELAVNARLNDTSAGANYIGMAFLNAGTAYVRGINASGTYAVQASLSGTVPFTWATGDFIEFNGVYEAA